MEWTATATAVANTPTTASKNYYVALVLEVELERLCAKEKGRRWLG